jgi:predicted restriction endonuclease
VVKVTVDRVVKDKFELARDLMRHRNPAGDLDVVLERALDALLVQLAKSKLGQVDRSQKKVRPAGRARITRRTRREVVERDGLRCSFVAADGRRCETLSFLEFDHVRPKGRGGTSEAENTRLLCQAHNALAAEGAYGKDFMQRTLLHAQGKKNSTGRTRAHRRGPL